jgi:hypothetical protein
MKVNQVTVLFIGSANHTLNHEVSVWLIQGTVLFVVLTVYGTPQKEEIYPPDFKTRSWLSKKFSYQEHELFLVVDTEVWNIHKHSTCIWLYNKIV